MPLVLPLRLTAQEQRQAVAATFCPAGDSGRMAERHPLISLNRGLVLPGSAFPRTVWLRA